MIKGDIYIITNTINGKRYIGQTRSKDGYMGRWKDHLYVAARADVPRWYIDRAIQQNGKENFKVELIESKEFENIDDCVDWMDEREIFYIKKFRSREHGYNLTAGGRGNREWCWSEEQRRKQSELMKSKPGFTKGTKLSEERKQRQRDVMKKIVTKEWLYKFQLAGHTENALKKRSDSLKKAVLQYSISGVFIKEYDGAISASKETKINKSSIGKACRYLQGRSGGYLWRFKKDGDVPTNIEPYTKKNKNKLQNTKNQQIVYGNN